jgi:hypothetical protein
MDLNVEYGIVRQLSCIEGTKNCLLDKSSSWYIFRHISFFELLISTERMLFIELIRFANSCSKLSRN